MQGRRAVSWVLLAFQIRCGPCLGITYWRSKQSQMGVKRLLSSLPQEYMRYVIDQLWKTTGWKMVVKQLSKEGRHLKSRAAPDRASASNGLTDGYHCSTCLSTSLTITSLSPPRSPSSLYPFILLTNSYQGLHLHDQPKVLLCSKSLHFLFLLPPPPSSDLFQKCTFTTFFLQNFVSR